ncbi:MAG: undecaprenyl-phosphate glucose phosphotransferase [Phycisphaerae bacterium]|jgi:Undecaprenyl-phosphate glucose phosphotransferase
MLKQHSHLMVSLLAVADACAVAVAWVASFWVRFTWLPVDEAKGVPAFQDHYLALLPLVVVVHLLIFSMVRLYRPRRDGSVVEEARDIVKAFAMAIVAVILLDYALPASNKISRQFIVTYAVLGTTLFILFRTTVRIVLGQLRRRGWNRRTAVIVGTGRAAQSLLHAIRNNSWMGIHVLYFVDDLEPGRPRSIRGVSVKGPIADLRLILEQQPADSVFIALSAQQAHRANDVLMALETSVADVRIVPELNPTFALRPTVSELDGLPILALRQTPLYGWNAFLKRGFDLLVGGFCLAVALLPMAVIAVLVRLSSPGPILYRQRRMGLDGREFTILKFRTMRVDAEDGTGPVWARRDDPRRTRIGRFLRRTSLDELPNLFNVLAGSMSLVGPRPERPELIARFKGEIPRYMLRHKMKAGMTGYAQIKGYRGNTSLKKRIQHDVYYIRHWSLGLDVQILAQTLTSTWFSRHET